MVGRPIGSRRSTLSERTDAAAATIAGPTPQLIAMTTTSSTTRCSKMKGGQPSHAIAYVIATGIASAAA